MSFGPWLFAFKKNLNRIQRGIEYDAASRKGVRMLQLALTFLLIAIVAGILGFTGVAAGAVEIAKILFFLFLVLFIVALIFGLARRAPPV